MKERNTLIDKLRGYACFLVLFGHVILGIRNSGIEVPHILYDLERFIWSFHISLFLFLSGNVYKITGEWKSKKTKWGFILYKFINLAVPYVFFSAVYVLINCFVGSANTQFSIMDILYIWKNPVVQYWYLYALFFLLCIYTFCSGILNNLLTTVILLGAGYILPFFGIGFGSFEIVIYSALSFGIGTVVSLEKTAKIPAWAKIIVSAVHITAGMLLSHSGVIEKAVIEEFILLVGIYASIQFISLIQKSKLVSRFLTFMNKYSFQIYLLHTIFTAGVRIALIKVGITNLFVHIILGCAAGLFVSVAVAIICEKCGMINIVFFPTKTLKKHDA